MQDSFEIPRGQPSRDGDIELGMQAPVNVGDKALEDFFKKVICHVILVDMSNLIICHVNFIIHYLIFLLCFFLCKKDSLHFNFLGNKSLHVKLL